VKMPDERNKQAKSEILSAIRQNLAKSKPFDLLHQEHHKPVQKNSSPFEEKSFVENSPVVSITSAEKNLAESFRENLVSIGGSCTIVKDENEAALEIKRIIEKLEAKKIAVSNDDLVGKTKNLFAVEIEVLQNASKQELFDCDLGITGAQFGIAETGTLVLESEKEFSRLTSLVPPVHICLLEAKNIRRTLGETLEILNANGREHLSRTITFITGPSRTSDIELTLAIGVHGPGELHVIIVE
jgi:L-lactate dehydrogenase complex protein LldG